MPSSEPPSPRIVPVEGDNRPFIQTYSQNAKFRVGDKVYLVKNGVNKGPYLVASVCSGNKFTLSLEDGTKVENGEEIDAGKLKST